MLDDLDLSWHGMSFRFSRLSTPALQGVQAGDQGTDILFKDGTGLRLTENADSARSYSITPIGAGAGALVIPFRVSGSLEDPGSAATVSWKRGGQSYLLGLPAGARADQAASLLTLPVGASAGAISLRAEGAAPAGAALVRVARAAQPRLPDAKSMPSADTLQTALDRFTDAAYSGWTVARYSAADGLWKMPGAAPGFSESIGVGLLAESIARGSWSTVIPLWTDALARQERRTPDAVLPSLTSPYVGGLRDYAASLQAASTDRVARARGLLSKSDVTLFSIPRLVPLLIDHGSPDLLQGALSLMTETSAAGLDVSLACGLLEGLMDYTREVGPNEELSRAARELIDKAILPAVQTVDAGVFLVESDTGRVDVRLSIRCGSLLMRAGESLSYPLSSAIGRGIVSSSLALAAEDGTLPVSLVLASGRISAREGQQGPESVYSLLPLDRRLPHEVSLAGALGQGSWLWTAAKLVSAENTGEEAHLVFEYPVGTPHHFMIQNLKPFQMIRMHGIPWHTDPTYAKYSDGWAYDSGTRTLYVKLTGRQPREDIDIRY